MVRSDSLLAQDNLPTFPETTAQQGEPSHESGPRLTKQQSKTGDTHREKQQCDVEGYLADETKEAPAMKLEPQQHQDEAAPAAAFICDCEGDAPTEGPCSWRRDTEGLCTAQIRTPTKASSAEPSAESERAQTQVDEQPATELPETGDTDEAPKSSRWAIPSETRVGGAGSDLRYTAKKPRRRGSFRLF